MKRRGFIAGLFALLAVVAGAQDDEGVLFEATAYCPCKICTLDGKGRVAYQNMKAIEGVTVAADWSVLPPGTYIDIEGLGTRYVSDRGAAIKGRRLDVFFNVHSAALQFGRQLVRVRPKPLF